MIIGFQTGVDSIEVQSLLSEFLIDPDDAFSGGYVLLTKSSSDTLVQFDKDGFGGSAAVTLATVTNATVTQADILTDSGFIV